ncbi:hypothetical protein [Deinococcus gobiensis]|uniref:Uncharacterized protein n=1 Tax=Deinococcus gobiensis (strain DSM 21396 / JCM 16679 / CGMCC 1.7299 / I-0) TaxID=745776 RepID=H8H1U4_DEIGI|nr:hypothetical protein [Deinococcus gobiensis]AFD27491.1 hypothetical protein DGo_PB0222 [Deinococcus gobiensis I-0]
MTTMHAARPTLIAQLHTHPARLITLTAAHGYGKTSLLYDAQDHIQTAFVRLSDADPDPLSLVLLLHRALPPAPQQQPASRPQMAYELLRPHLTAASAAQALRHDLQAYPKLTFLIDEIERLTVEGRRFLRDNVIVSSPPQVRFVLAMTDEEQFPALSLRSKFGLLRLKDDDLALTQQEMEAMGLTPEQIQHVAGWPAAAALLALGEEPEAVARELLQVLPEAFVARLRRASLLSTWRTHDPANTALQLGDNWLTEARTYGIPMTRVGTGAYAPHPIVQDVLYEQLRERPTEYARAQQDLAGVLKAHHQPLQAVDAYIAAGNSSKAKDLLENVIPYMQNAEQIRAALPQLRHLMAEETLGSPLMLPYARALFDAGEIIEALNLAGEVLRHGTALADAHATLGQFRLRTGNIPEAARHLREALSLTVLPADLIRLRSQLALALALRAREAGRTFLKEDAQYDADRVIHEASLDAQLQVQSAGSIALAHIARVLSLCARGQRHLARVAALHAKEQTLSLSPGPDQVVALTLLAAYYADDGQQPTAEALFLHAEHLIPQEPEPALHVTLAQARLALRSGKLDRVNAYAQRAQILAQQMSNTTANKEASIYLLIIAALIGGAQGDFRFQQIRARHGSDATMMRAMQQLELAFLHLRKKMPQVGETHDSPAEVRAVLAVLAYKTDLRNPAREYELVDLRNRVGPGVILSYAERLQVTLPPGLGEPIYKLEIMALRDVPYVFANGHAVNSTPATLVTLLALAWRSGRLSLSDEDAYGLGSRPGSSTLRMQYHRVRQALDTATGCVDTVTGSRGTLSLAQWDVTLDVFELETAALDQLSLMYRSPVYGHAGKGMLSRPVEDTGERRGTFLLEMRTHAREVLSRRIGIWATTHPVDARVAWAQLLQVDPELAPYLTL